MVFFPSSGFSQILHESSDKIIMQGLQNYYIVAVKARSFITFHCNTNMKLSHFSSLTSNATLWRQFFPKLKFRPFSPLDQPRPAAFWKGRELRPWRLAVPVRGELLFLSWEGEHLVRGQTHLRGHGWRTSIHSHRRRKWFHQGEGRKQQHLVGISWSLHSSNNIWMGG